MIARSTLRTGLAVLLLLITLAARTALPAAAGPVNPDQETASQTGNGFDPDQASPSSPLNDAQWKRFGIQVARTLSSSNENLKESALRMIIQYGPDLSLGRAATIDVVRIYHSHPNDNLRRMAVVALGRMDDDWGYDFLHRSVPYEKSPAVRHTLYAVRAKR